MTFMVEQGRSRLWDDHVRAVVGNTGLANPASAD
jgi:hypothetical protein